MRGEQAIFNLEIKKKSGSSINPDIHHSKVFSSVLILYKNILFIKLELSSWTNCRARCFQSLQFEFNLVLVFTLTILKPTESISFYFFV